MQGYELCVTIHMDIVIIYLQSDLLTYVFRRYGVLVSLIAEQAGVVHCSFMIDKLMQGVLFSFQIHYRDSTCTRVDFSILTIIDLFFALVKNLVESISAGASASKLKADGKAFIYTGSSWVWGRYRIFAVTLRNIPEGMAVGVVYAGWVSGEAGVSISAAFAAGAMLYVVVEELIPEMSSGRHSNAGTVAFALGFVLMMVLDVALG